MFRIDAPGHVGNRFVGGNPFFGVEGTTLSADFANAVMDELAGFIESEGLVLSKLDSAQLAQAVALAVRRLTGGVLDFTAPANLTAGDGLLVGDTFGVVVATVLIAQPAQLYTLGRFTLPKEAADSFTPGPRLYWNAGTAKLTTTAAGNRTVGVSAVTAAPGTTSAAVILSGPPNL
jgi:predicted RecA/RadA family phage recombinase